MATKNVIPYKPGLRMPPYINFQNPDVKAKDLKDAAKNNQSTISAEGGVIPLIYGKGRVGGKVFAITQYQGSLVVGAVFCEGEVDSIVSVDINDTTATTGTTVETFLGTTTQTRSGILATALGTASYTDTLRYAIPGTSETASTCYAVIKVKPGELSGFPRIAAIIKGKKVYDPRDANQVLGTRSTYKWSNNPALCLADLITSNVYGLGKTVDWVSVAKTANFNDQFVGSPQEASRQLDIVLEQEQEVKQWIEVLRAYASCFVLEENGIYQLIPDKPIGYAANLKGTSTSSASISYNAAQSVSTELSIEVSVKANVALSASLCCIVAKGTSLSANQYGLYHDKSVNRTYLITRSVGGTANATHSFANTIPEGSYQTISVDYRGVSAVGGNTAFTAAINGVSVTTTASTFGTMTNTTDSMAVGYLSGSNPFNGQIDELRVWNRFRSLPEILSNYSRAIVTKADPSLVIHVPFNEGFDSITKASGSTTWTAASIAADLTGNTTGATILPVPTYGTASTNWTQYDNPADFFRFDHLNMLADSVKFKRRGVANQPTIVEIGFTDTTSKPWREDFARYDMSQDPLSNGKRRVSNVAMPGILRYTQAYREAIERYKNALSDITVLFGSWDDSFVLQVGDGIQVHHPTIETWNPGTQTYTELFKPFRITSIREREFSRFDIVGVEYDPANYSTTVTTSPTYPDTNLPNPNNPPAPSGATLTNTSGEILYKSPEGVWGSRIQATITPATSITYPYTKGFLVKLYRNSGTIPLVEQVFIRADTTNPATGTVVYLSSVLNPFENSATITDTANYILNIATVSTMNDILSSSIVKNPYILGKTNSPSVITNFTGFELNNKVILSWDEAADFDVWRYDIRYYAASGGTDTASLQAAYITATHAGFLDALNITLEGIQAGTWRFLISAVDSTGNYSAYPAYKDVDVTLDLDAYGLITKVYSDWTGIGLSRWDVRGSDNPLFSTDWADPWSLNEASQDNQTASFGVTVGALENTHGSSLVFTGLTTGPYISITNAGAYTAAANTFTIEAYIYINSNVTGNMTIFSTRPVSAVGAWTFEAGTGSSGSGRLFVCKADGVIVRESAENTLVENTWYHVCAKVSAGTVTMYVNNIEVAYGTSNAYTFAANSNVKLIGCRTTSIDNRFNGIIKRVKWYSTALSDADRLKSAEYDNNSKHAIAGLLGAWAIKEGTGTVVTDSTTTSNGAISNGATWTNISYFMSEAWDYGTINTGNWLSTINVTDHTGTSSKYILTSQDNISWTYNPGNTVKATARYVKAYVETTGNMSISEWPTMSLILEPKTETTPLIRTTTSGGILTLLDNEYAAVKSVLATPVAFGVTTTTVSPTISSISAVIDRLLIAPVTGLLFTAQNNGTGNTATAIISTASYAIAASPARYLEFDLWLPAANVDTAPTIKAIVTYSSGGSTTATVIASGGNWVTSKTALSASSTISSVTISYVSTIVGIHTIVVRNMAVTDGSTRPGGDLHNIWNWPTLTTDRADPTPNTLGGDMINKKCGPTNSFYLYAFKTPLGASPVPVQIDTDVTVKFEGS